MSSGQEKLSVMIVDDEIDIVEIMADYVAEAGYFPVKFTNGQAALEFSLCNRVDIALIDMMMPQVSGFSLIQSIRANRKTFPIIVFSGNFPRDVADYLWQLDILTILEKPIDENRLHAVLRQASRLVG